MELYYRQDELQNLIDTLESLVDDSEYYQQYNDILNDIKYKAIGILEYVEEEIAEQEKKELEEENRQYEKSRI